MVKIGDLANDVKKMFDNVTDEEWKRRDDILKKDEAQILANRLRERDETLKKSGFDFSEIEFIRNYNKNLIGNGITFKHQILENPKAKEIKIIGDEIFRDDINLSYIFRGDHGRGKTLLCHYIANGFIQKDLSVLLVSDKQFRKDAMRWGKDELCINRYISVDFLALNDINRMTKPLTPTAIDFFNEVICGRVKKRKKTIITGNKSIKSIVTTVTIDRMRGFYKTLYFYGESMRPDFDL